MQLKNRRDMDKEYMWDLSRIFKTREDFEMALEEANKEVVKISDLCDNFTDSAETLKNSLDFIYSAAQKMELVYLYAFLHKAGDNGDGEYQDMEGRAVNLIVSFGAASSFMRPKITALDEETLKDYLSNESLEVYRHTIMDIYRGREHTLSEEQEKTLAMLSDAANVPSDAFEMLESVDMDFPNTKGADGNETALTHGSFRVFLESENREVRREAYEKYFGEFKRYINTFAALYGGSVKMDTFFSDVRGFGSACEASLFDSNVPTEVYDSLISATHDGLSYMRKYIELRKKALGLDEIEMYDLYCPMVPEIDFSLTYEEAKDLVKKALRPLGEEYGKLLDRAYYEKWMDVYENKGKTTGAFSCGVYGVHPYVLLNFTGTLDDAFTMAHELGHAMHSYFSAKEQEYVNSDYKIMAAEVASTVNEVLLTKYLLSVEKNKNRKAYILNHFLESFRTTLFRQTLFAEFEKRAHDMFKEGIPLKADSLNALYRELNLLYYDGVNVGELHDIEWARIPHFYNSFYVYQYATGFSAAVAIADNIINSSDPSAYLKFLSLGGSAYPIDELMVAGVDLTSPEPVKNALAEFDKCIGELEKLIL